MSPERIRLLRGERTRAELARELGVTPLTVLRWELPEDNKEARRPRRAMVEALERLEAQKRAAVERPAEDPESQALAADVAAIVEVQALFGAGAWRRAETELLSLLAGARLTTPGGRALATLELVQQQLLARLDVRGGLTAILPLLADAEAGRLPPAVTARVHAGAAMLFSAPDVRLFDPGRVNTHVEAAEGLLGPRDEGRIVLALARLSAARFIGIDIFKRTHREVEHLASESPILQRLLALLKGLGAEITTDAVVAARLNRAALEEAARLGLHSLVIGALANASQFGLAKCLPADVVLGFVAMARGAAQEGGVGPIDPYLRVLGCECDAFLRLGRIDDARRTIAEARELAVRAGVPPYASAAAEIHLCSLTNHRERLRDLAAALEVEVAPLMRPVVKGLALYARATAASLAGDYDVAARLADDAFEWIEGMAAVGFASHDVLIEGMIARALGGDYEGARRGMRRAEKLREQFPSAYHAALAQRIEGLVLVAEGRPLEGLPIFRASRSPFVEAGDVVQDAISDVAIALAESVAAMEGADTRLSAALAAVQRFGVTPRPFSRERKQNAPPPEPGSLAERVDAAAESLIGRIVTPDAVGRDLLRAAADVLPGRRAVLAEEPAELPTGKARVERWFEIKDASGQTLHFGVEGTIDEEQAQALQTLVVSARRGLSASVTRTADPGTIDRDPDILPELPEFIAASPLMRRLRRSIAQISTSRATILVTGESGTGKEVVARAVHDLSSRARRAYVAFNCATVPADLFDSQLFGHKRGAFTGADRDEPGVIRAADKGTVFLDEIGELPLEVQPKLLRFLENGEVFPLGERHAVTVDVRVIAATHRDPAKLVREGRFREDLYYRLNVVPLHVPPLRDRPEDVIALANRFLERFAPAGAEPPRLSPEALMALADHPWAGNVRELRNVLERTMAFGLASSVLSATDIRF